MGNRKVGIIVLAILGFLVLVIGVPLGINAIYQCDTVIIKTQWGAADVLNYYGAILSAFVTMAGLVITIHFTMRQVRRDSYLKRESDKWAKIEAVVVDILNEINPMPTLRQMLDIGFTDPKEASNLLHKFQISCRTATDQLNAYLNTRDYPRVKALIDKIADVAEKFFQVGQKEVEQYNKLQQWELRDSTLKLLKMAEERPDALPAEEIAKHKETIKNTDGIRFEDIEHAIQELHVELIRIYETESRLLLQLKGATFETISAQTQANADSMLSARLK